MTYALAFEELTLGYDRHPAVHQLDGEVADGSLTAIVGPNGAGKSTLLKGVTGVLRPLAGQVRFGTCTRSDIAYLPQQSDIDRSFPITVVDLVAMGLWSEIGGLFGLRAAHRARIDDAISAVGLTGFESRIIGSLSGGQFQRALFARLLLQNAQLVLLDEPFTAIDAKDDGRSPRCGAAVARRGTHGDRRSARCRGRPGAFPRYPDTGARSRGARTHSESSDGCEPVPCTPDVRGRCRPAPPPRQTRVVMWETLIQPFAEFSFMRRAMMGCIAISVGGTPVGVFLLLRRMSLTGDAMAHAILPGAAVGFLVAGLSLGAMTVGGLIAGMAVALLSGFVARVTALREDASLAAFYLISLALGVLIVSTRGSNVDLMHVLFGTVLALDNAALILLSSIASITLVALAFIFRPLVLECADPQFLRSVSGLSTITHFTFLALVVMNLVGGFHALGTLMAVGIMILPAAAARFWAVSIGGLILAAVAIAIASSVCGLLVSYHFGLPSGPAIILVAGIVYGVSLMLGPVGSLAAPLFRHRVNA